MLCTPRSRSRWMFVLAGAAVAASPLSAYAIDTYDFESDTVGAVPSGITDDSGGAAGITVASDPSGPANKVGQLFGDGFGDRAYISRSFPEQTSPFVARWNMYLGSNDYLADGQTTAGATVGLNDAYGGHIQNSWTGPYADFQYFEDGSQGDDAGDGEVLLRFFGAGDFMVNLDEWFTVEISDIDFANGTETINVRQGGTSLGSFASAFRNNGLPYDSGTPNSEVFEFRTTGAGGGTMYLDDLSIVPEPASLLALGGLLTVLGLRRRGHGFGLQA